jgi:hypothetical protein
MAERKASSLDDLKKIAAPIRILPKLPTGIGPLDLALQGGIVEGRTTLITGRQKTGKTTTLAHIIASYQRQERRMGRNRAVVFYATEDKYDEDYFKWIGVDCDPDLVIMIPPDYLEITGDYVLDIARHELRVGLQVFDSLRMTTTMHRLERSLDEPMFAPEAKIINDMLVQLGIAQGQRIRMGESQTMIFLNHETYGIAQGGGPAPVIVPRGMVQMMAPATRIRMKSPRDQESITYESMKIPLMYELNFVVEANLGGRSKIGGSYRIYQSQVEGHMPGQVDDYEFWRKQGALTKYIQGRGEHYTVGEREYPGRLAILEAWREDPELYYHDKQAILPLAIEISLTREKRKKKEGDDNV